MRATIALLVAMTAVTGCLGADDLDAAGEGVFLVRRDTRACGGAQDCERYQVAAVNGVAARCAYGVESAACAVVSLDLSRLGVGEATERALRDAVTPSLTSPVLALRGRVVESAEGARFVATAAWRAATERPVFGTFVEVTAAGQCTSMACAASLRRVNTLTDPVAVSGVDVRAVQMDARASDAAVAAMRDGGILVAGSRGTDEAGRAVVRAEQVFVPVAE